MMVAARENLIRQLFAFAGHERADWGTTPVRRYANKSKKILFSHLANICVNILYKINLARIILKNPSPYPKGRGYFSIPFYTLAVLQILLTITLLPHPSIAQTADSPGLLVSPTRILMEGRNRSGVINIANNGKKAGVYTINVINGRMSEEGKISEATEPLPNEKFASDFLRIAPRRITLQPGESQAVRILARKPADLADGEYMSRLSFHIKPMEEESENASQENKDLSITIKANYGVTIPVIVRQGNLTAQSNIKDLKLSSEKGKPSLHFIINRTGNKSLYGDLEVKYIKQDSGEYILKSMGGIAVYASNSKRIMDIELDMPDGITINKGKLVVIYREKDTEGGEVIAKGELIL